MSSHLESLGTLAGGEVVAGDTLGVGAALLEPEAGVRAEARPTLLQHGALAQLVHNITRVTVVCCLLLVVSPQN